MFECGAETKVPSPFAETLPVWAPVSELQTNDPDANISDNLEDLDDGDDIPMQVERQGWQQTFVYLVEPIEHIFRATIPEQYPFVGSCVWILFISYTLIQL